MSAETKEPKVGEKFYDNDGEEMEIEEVTGTVADQDGVFEVASDGSFYDIFWNAPKNQWQETDDEEEEEN